MYFIIQENLFREEGHAKLINVLDRFNFDYELIKVLPFIEDVEFETSRKDCFVFGSLKLARLSKKYGWNPGAAIGLIQYPRFVRDEEEIKRRSLELARRLKVGLGQERVTVVFPDETIMLEDDDNNIDF